RAGRRACALCVPAVVGGDAGARRRGDPRALGPRARLGPGGGAVSGARPYKGYLGPRVISREAPLRSDREQLLREALAYTGGDIGRAAALVGIDRRMAERMLAENPELEEALEEARTLVRSRLASVLRPWEELAPKAQEVLEAALVAVKKDGTPDWKHRLKAALEVLDRAIGKPVA